ncbi:MAG: thiamine-phosphate kinase [Gammaproteobacteria bacterium]|nr:thiamine-phosphate kinase [Gammaproteobacteria bacterium]
MASEFAIIEQYFSDVGKAAENTLLGVGDDAAVVDLPAGQQLVVAMDTLIEGTHFPQNTSPADIAYKSLAVNLSDLAAMGAKPAWFLMSLTLDNDDPQWLSRFAEGLKETSNEYGLQLIGGDTCRGKLAISIQIAGHLPNGQFVTRQGANPGDIILVSGVLGNAALGLAQQQGNLELTPALRSHCVLALNRPRPRLELGPFLRQFASSAIDISDGLVGDLKHILKASACGARISLESLPVNQWIEQHGAWEYALGAGDDYEICCTLPAGLCGEVDNWNNANPDCRLTPIGEITESGYYLQDGDDMINLDQRQGYRHFA